MAASPDVQVIQAISADLTSAQSSADALERAARAHGGRAADEVYLCAGMSRPQFFIEASADDLQSVSAAAAAAAAREKKQTGGRPGMENRSRGANGKRQGLKDDHIVSRSN